MYGPTSSACFSSGGNSGKRYGGKAPQSFGLIRQERSSDWWRTTTKNFVHHTAIYLLNQWLEDELNAVLILARITLGRRITNDVVADLLRSSLQAKSVKVPLSLRKRRLWVCTLLFSEKGLYDYSHATAA